MIVFLLSVVFIIIIYLMVPYSPVKKRYYDTVKELAKEYKLPKKIIEEKDLKRLPVAMRKYFINNGYLGIESTEAIILDHRGASFSMGEDKPDLIIRYLVHSFVKKPTRVAFIDSKLYGIPFQGIDVSKDGGGSMKGIMAKHIPVFNTEFEDFIDSSYLAECILHPSLALQECITYKQIDDYSVEATISNKKAKTTGIFYFTKQYELDRLEVKERYNSDTESMERWSAAVEDYQEFNGVRLPTKFRGVWHLYQGDVTYFYCDRMKIYFK